MDKKIRIKKYNKHPEVVGDEIEVTIMNNKVIKPIVKKTTTPRKPKQPRMTIMMLVLEMRAGFAAVNQRIDKIEDTLKRHEEIFKRNNLK
jgi:hypothetical protein